MGTRPEFLGERKPRNAQDVIALAFARSLRNAPSTPGYDYRARPIQAWEHPIKTERSIVAMLRSLAQYVDDYREQWPDSQIGLDGVLGDDGWGPMLRGFRALLNGECGRLDCGALDAAACDLWAYAGFAEEL
jgi:hypothetical protein